MTQTFDQKINKNIGQFNSIKSGMNGTHDEIDAFKAFKMYSIVNNSIIACAAEDAKNKNDEAITKFISGIVTISPDEKKSPDQQKSAKQEVLNQILAQITDKDYTSLKEAVYATRVLGVRKNNIQKAGTIAKIPGRIALEIIGVALGITGDALKTVGKLVKLVPVAGFIVDRIPGLSYESNGKPHNLLEGLGGGLQAIKKEIQKKSQPIHSTKSQTVAKALLYR